MRKEGEGNRALRNTIFRRGKLIHLLLETSVSLLLSISKREKVKLKKMQRFEIVQIKTGKLRPGLKLTFTFGKMNEGFGFGFLPKILRNVEPFVIFMMNDSLENLSAGVEGLFYFEDSE